MYAGMKLPVISGKELIKLLGKKGFERKRQKGSHVMLERREPPPPRHVTVPDHPEIRPGTLCAILKQAELSRDDFFALYRGST